VIGKAVSGARIEDGDLLVAEEYEDPPDGTVVMALLRNGEEVTVKRLYREGDMVRPKPENGEYDDLAVPAQNAQIQGAGRTHESSSRGMRRRRGELAHKREVV
jgi:repressor LexA